MRVGILTSIHTTVLQYCARDLAWGFRRLGHSAYIVDENSIWAECNGKSLDENDLVRFAMEVKPDLMIQFDGVRYNHSQFLSPDVPWVAWILDRLPWFWNKGIAAMLGPKDFTFAMFDEMSDQLVGLGYPKERTRTLHVGVNLDVYNPTPRPKQDRFDCDIAFVTRLNSQMPESRAETRKAAARVAIQTGLRVGLFGTGWDEHCEFKEFYRGPVEPGEELAACFQQAKLHIHANEDTHWHMRVLECAASGGNIACYVKPVPNRDRPPWAHEFGTWQDLDICSKPSLYNSFDPQEHSYAARAKKILEIAI